MRITAILYVIKILLYLNNHQLSLLYFWLFLMFRTSVQPVQVIISSLIYYYSITVLWSFSCNICVVDFWPVFLNGPDECSLILKLVLGCVRKLSVVCIQTIHIDFLPPQVYGRLWRGFQLGVQTCSLQLIDFHDIKYPSSSSFNTYF